MTGPPRFVDEHGDEHVLGPRELALVLAVLATAAKYRRCASYALELHVKHASVVVQSRQHEGTFTYGTQLEQKETA